MFILLEKISQTLLHMSVAFILTYILTGSWEIGGAVAVIEPICNVVLLPFHTRFWRRLRLKQKMKTRQYRQQHLSIVFS
ncbi:DUF2061 domain-containing protein [Pelistega suis]|uniref:DUF2061 domain-containing protein n=1 Tax=Pelistega suis TaxID=1631957 RepID=UPI00211CADB7|nr:DUF2061 domain-containing protein [Pelistega suis]MCQ9328558.1 DUF2061 domain-containing protein [Pelistega suis]